MIPVASFDQISVISDLHMGGKAGFQIFGQAALLAAFIDDLRQNGSGDCALVINGDTVDFLAEPGATYFDSAGAIDKLDRIFGDNAFKPVWKSLKDFVHVAKRHLVITLGNHDVELALPWVREHLLDALSDGNPAARARITLAFDGTGFACNVGSASVLCLHGNEVDTWNVTDYEALRRLACDAVQGRPVREWTPNAGTKLVIDVMNSLKQEHPFIDLLKPEKEAAVKLLLAIWPEQRLKLNSVAAIAARRVWDATRRRVGLLSTEDDGQAEPGGREALARIAGRSYGSVPDTDKLMDHIESQFQAGKDPLAAVHQQQNQQLGWWDALVSVVRQKQPFEIAWEAVKEVAGDTSFQVRQVDTDFERIDELAGEPFDYVIAGHTHKARILGRRKGKGLYFNSGTWATLMQLTTAQLGSADSFRPVFERLKKARTIAELGNLVFYRPTVVTLRNNKGRTQAALEMAALKKGKIAMQRPDIAP
jgi:UDP-2,3-diacylglucosamine pyrophosphatase LpxH